MKIAREKIFAYKAIMKHIPAETAITPEILEDLWDQRDENIKDRISNYVSLLTSIPADLPATNYVLNDIWMNCATVVEEVEAK